MRSLLSSLLLVSSLGCGVTSVEGDLPDVEPVELSEAQSDLTVSKPPFDVTVQNWGVVTPDATVTFLGRASRLLSNAFSFVPDDAFGTTDFTGRTFEATLAGGHETNTLLSGLPLLLKLETVTGAERTFFVRLTAGARVRSGSGSTALSVTPRLRPVYVAGPGLAYRVQFTAPAAVTGARVLIGSASLVAARSGTSWVADLSYEQLAAGLGGAQVQVIATAPARSYTRKLKLGVKLEALDLTTLDPYDAWPPVTCGPAAYACVAAAPTDLGACGDYREVQACAYRVQCEQSFQLIESPVAALEAARTTFNASAVTGGTWARIGAVRAFDLQGCGDFALEAIVQKLADEQGAPTFSMGTVAADAAAAGPFFSTTYSSAGPALLQAANAWGSDGAPEAWSYTANNGACHNCTEFEDRVVLFYPGTWRVVVIDGVHGWDS
ncbi:MAG: hypothetical protein JNK82_11760 [Myxococcaceae bacterium]|nr:hypothetical protein [Myxococcaceae bacterium]